MFDSKNRSNMARSHLRKNLYLNYTDMARKIPLQGSTETTEVPDEETNNTQQDVHLLQGELMAVQRDLKATQDAYESQVQERHTAMHELSMCKAELQSSKAELKIFKECAESQGQRVTEVEARMADEKHQREAVERRLQHILKLISSVEDIHWERARTQTNFDADAWRAWCQRIEGALEPLIRQSKV